MKSALAEPSNTASIGRSAAHRQTWWCFPLAAGVIMLWASVSPWLHDPLGSLSTAWQLPVDPGWQIRAPGLNYGLLSVAIALGSWLSIIIRILPAVNRLKLPRLRYKGLLCLVPMLFFPGQMVCCDFSSMERIAQHEQQALLIQQLFFYSTPDQLVLLHPFVLHVSTFWGRWQVLLDQLDYGVLLPLLACSLLAIWERFDSRSMGPETKKSAFLLPSGIALLFCLMFARAFIGAVYEKQAQSALSAGAYTQALSLLDTARMFLPSLNDAVFYHLERGQALYYLSSLQPTPESRAYLAASYRALRDFPDAFQQDYLLWLSSPSTPWIVDELSGTLEAWIDSQQPLRPVPRQNVDNALAVLPWIQTLERIDTTNVYTLYLESRIYYVSQSYSACISLLGRIPHLSREPAILSSVYTYLAFCEMGVGDPVAGRRWLFYAITFDPGYRNNTAWEALSGLH